MDDLVTMQRMLADKETTINILTALLFGMVSAYLVVIINHVRESKHVYVSLAYGALVTIIVYFAAAGYRG